MFTSDDIPNLVRAYTSLTLPLLESCSQVWNPNLTKDKESLEGVQRCFTRKVYQRAKMKKVNYFARCKRLNLKPLQYRRIAADIFMVFKIVYNLVDLKFDDYFCYSRSRSTRGHSRKLSKIGHAVIDCRKYFFSNRVVNYWNWLPQDAVSATSLNSFKLKLKKLDLSHFCTWGPNYPPDDDEPTT